MFRCIMIAVLVLASPSCARETADEEGEAGLSDFWDSSHHWYDIRDEERIIDPLPQQKRYDPSEVRAIAENVLLFQKLNGGWPKNYDMRAVLTDEQKAAVLRARADTGATTFDNGATYSHVAYLAKAFDQTGDERYRKGSLEGLAFILRAQYEHGGWPQYFPDRSGYRRYATYNDGAMIGVMKLLQKIISGKREFKFVDASLKERIKSAFAKGIDCIIRSQIMEKETLTVWCQQHDDVTLLPRNARTFELASATSMESAGIVLFLMSLDDPSPPVVKSVEGAVRWFERSRILGIRVETVEAPKTEYIYHTASDDKVVVEDTAAPPIWARFYEPGTNRPLFANRDGRPVYSMTEVDRERRTGYAWYTYDPAKVLAEYPKWRRRNRL